MDHPRTPISELKCLYCNARSLRKNISFLKFAIKNLNCDVAMVTETWLNEFVDMQPILGELSNNYCYIRSDRGSKKGGGVLIIVKQSIAFETVLTDSVPDAYEILCCDLKSDQFTVRVVVVYRAPSCNSNDTIKLIEVVSDLSSSEVNCVICGDLNLPDIDWSRNPPSSTTMASKHFVRFCQTNKFVQHVRSPTRGTHILDLVLSSHKNLVKDANISSPLGSGDHSCITYSISVTLHHQAYKLRRAFNIANYDQICEYLCSVRWRFLLERFSSVDEKYEFFLSTLHWCIDQYVPIVKQRVSYNNLPPHLSNLYQSKEKAWETLQSDPTPQNVNNFEFLKNKFDNRLRKYNNYVERKLLQNPKKCSFYRLLNSRLKSTPTHIPVLKDGEGNTAVTDQQLTQHGAQSRHYVHRSGSCD